MYVNFCAHITLLFCSSHFLQIKQCDRCQRNAAETGVPDILHPVKVVDKVWYLVGIDLIDAHKVTTMGNRYILTQTDYFSKYVEAVPLPSKSAEAVAQGLYATYRYCRHGAPAHIISDQGEFINKVTIILHNTLKKCVHAEFIEE